MKADKESKIHIGITGSDGLLGSHIRAFFYSQPDFEVLSSNRQTMADEKELLSFVGKCDIIVHCAGMNRGDDEEIFKTNINLTNRLIEACKKNNSRPHIFFPSSTHVFRDTAYGRSKRVCAELLSAWSADSGGLFMNMILPNVFGEGGRPFYNSVVSTFCHQLIKGEEATIIKNEEIEIMHTLDIARFIATSIFNDAAGEMTLKGYLISIRDLLEKLKTILFSYEKSIIPDLHEKIDLQLFNTLRSYRYPHLYPGNFSLIEDTRGSLVEFIKSQNSGQCFLSHTKPHIIRGNHYHLEKFERFAVIKGNAIIRIRKLFTPEVVVFEVSGDKMQYLDIPVMHTHQIENIGSEDLVTLFWAGQLFDSANPDTFTEPV
jgi:UDP-2-acetamido-2,6-beta-L-arabino-hexul-4-ose reductase